MNVSRRDHIVMVIWVNAWRKHTRLLLFVCKPQWPNTFILPSLFCPQINFLKTFNIFLALHFIIIWFNLFTIATLNWSQLILDKIVHSKFIFLPFQHSFLRKRKSNVYWEHTQTFFIAIGKIIEFALEDIFNDH